MANAVCVVPMVPFQTKTSGTYYLSHFQGGTVESAVQHNFPKCVIKDAIIRVASKTGPNNWTLTVRKNGASTTKVATITANGETHSTGNDVQVEDGDQICLELVIPGGNAGYIISGEVKYGNT